MRADLPIWCWTRGSASGILSASRANLRERRQSDGTLEVVPGDRAITAAITNPADDAAAAPASHAWHPDCHRCCAT